MNNILAGIVLYNPQIERLILELKSIEKQVQKICMFDNGSNNYSEIEKVIESISFRDIPGLLIIKSYWSRLSK